MKLNEKIKLIVKMINEGDFCPNQYGLENHPGCRMDGENDEPTCDTCREEAIHKMLVPVRKKEEILVSSDEYEICKQCDGVGHIKNE